MPDATAPAADNAEKSALLAALEEIHAKARIERGALAGRTTDGNANTLAAAALDEQELATNLLIKVYVEAAQGKITVAEQDKAGIAAIKTVLEETQRWLKKSGESKLNLGPVANDFMAKQNKSIVRPHYAAMSRRTLFKRVFPGAAAIAGLAGAGFVNRWEDGHESPFSADQDDIAALKNAVAEKQKIINVPGAWEPDHIRHTLKLLDTANEAEKKSMDAIKSAEPSHWLVETVTGSLAGLSAIVAIIAQGYNFSDDREKDRKIIDELKPQLENLTKAIGYVLSQQSVQEHMPSDKGSFFQRS